MLLIALSHKMLVLTDCLFRNRTDETEYKKVPSIA